MADGMGGHAAGEVASKRAVDAISAEWMGKEIRHAVARFSKKADIEERRQLLSLLRSAFVRAGKAIALEGEKDPSKRGMGTTCTGFVIAGGEALFAHVGDSRAYLVRDGIPVLLSEDHTICARLRAVGIEKGVPGVSPQKFKGVLTNAMGIDVDLHVDTFVLPVYSGDRIVLCSDGVHDYFSEVEVGALVMAAPSPAKAAQSLIAEALRRGGEDNATAIIVKVMEADSSALPLATQERNESALRDCPLFAGLSPQQRLRAYRITIPRDYRAGEAIPRVALEDRVCFVLLSGTVRASEEGEESKVGAVLQACALAAPLLVSELQYRATTDVALLMIRRNDFYELCVDDPLLGEVLSVNVAGYLAR